MKRPPRILLAGGGTGGHVYPAIAIADAIRSRDSEAAIAFAGTRERIEWSAVPKAGYSIYPITTTGLNRRHPLRNLRVLGKLSKGLLQSLALVRAFDPDAAVGTGGYVSGPVLLAAHLRRRPIVIQEQNALAGITNKLLASKAAQIHIAFDETQASFPKKLCRINGNPTRSELRSADDTAAREHFGIPDNATVLFVFGGSLGSRALNQALERHLPLLMQDAGLFILWQTGRRYYGNLHNRVPEHERLRLMEYVDRMDLAYAAADLAVCRAGALTCSELLATGTPAILVPSPNVTADHQTVNAKAVETVGAAIHVREKDLDKALQALVPGLLQDSEKRATMTRKARAAAAPDAAARIADDVLKLVGWTPPAQLLKSS